MSGTVLGTGRQKGTSREKSVPLYMVTVEVSIRMEDRKRAVRETRGQ